MKELGLLAQGLAHSPAALVALALLVGLIIGSFLNVVIHRLPIMLDRHWREQCAELAADSAAATLPAAAVAPGRPAARYNLMVPSSRCAACGAPIRAWHNIPVISYLLLRGRCADCHARISARYPVVELISGIATGLVAWRLGFGWTSLCAMFITWSLIALFFIDLDHQLLPDSLTLTLLWAGLLASLAGWAVPGRSLPVSPQDALLGAAIGYGSLWLVFQLFRLLTGREGMGHGDFKLLAALGAWLGWRMLLPIVLLSAGVGALTGLALIAVRRHEAGKPIPFGPFLAAAGWVAMMWGPQIVGGYLSLYGPHG